MTNSLSPVPLLTWYKYDYAGRRVLKATGGTPSFYCYDSD